MEDKELLNIKKKTESIIVELDQFAKEIEILNVELGNAIIKSDKIVQTGQNIAKKGMEIGVNVYKNYSDGKIDKNAAKLGGFISFGTIAIGGGLSVYGWLQRKISESQIRQQMRELNEKRKELSLQKIATLNSIFGYLNEVLPWLQATFQKLSRTTLPLDKIGRRQKLIDSISLVTESIIKIAILKGELLFTLKHLEKYKDGFFTVFFDKNEINTIKEEVNKLIFMLYDICVDEKMLFNKDYYQYGINEGTLFLLNNRELHKVDKRWTQLYKSFNSIRHKEKLKAIFNLNRLKEIRNFEKNYLKNIQPTNEKYKFLTQMYNEFATQVDQIIKINETYSEEKINNLLNKIKRRCNQEKQNKNENMVSLVQYLTILSGDKSKWWDIDKIILNELLNIPFKTKLNWKIKSFKNFLWGIVTGVLVGGIIGAIGGGIYSIFKGHFIYHVKTFALWGGGLLSLITSIPACLNTFSEEYCKFINQVYDKYYNIRIKDIAPKKTFFEKLFS